jgi:hypothetical protein
MISKLKSLPTKWEKIFVSYTSDKGLIISICREIRKLNFPKYNDQPRILRRSKMATGTHLQTT